MQIEVKGQPLTDIPLGKQYEIIKREPKDGGLKEIEKRTNEFAAKLLDEHFKTTGQSRSKVKIQPFKIKQSSQSGKGISWGDQSAQLRDMENWMAPATQVLAFKQHG